MSEHQIQKYREAIISKYPDWTDSDIDLTLEMIEVVSLILD